VKASEEVLSGLPQRDPFLFVDEIVERKESSIETRFTLTGEEEFFKGHFPGNPIMPGVLLQEALFQTGALLMGGNDEGLGVVTKVEKARFKGLVKPKQTLEITVSELERLANATYFKGQIKVDSKVVLSLLFTCALINQE
jgi:3-hydroxyacyl-[acyl-carrier-protein] dehydratase